MNKTWDAIFCDGDDTLFYSEEAMASAVFAAEAVARDLRYPLDEHGTFPLPLLEKAKLVTPHHAIARFEKTEKTGRYTLCTIRPDRESLTEDPTEFAFHAFPDTHNLNQDGYDPAAVRWAVEKVYDWHFPGCLEVIPGIEEVLQTLAERGNRLILTTNAPKKAMERRLEQTGFAHYFERVYGRENKIGKSKHAFFNRIANELHVDLRKCAMLDDRGRYLDVGSELGIYGVWMNYTSTRRGLAPKNPEIPHVSAPAQILRYL